MDECRARFICACMYLSALMVLLCLGTTKPWFVENSNCRLSGLLHTLYTHCWLVEREQIDFLPSWLEGAGRNTFLPARWPQPAWAHLHGETRSSGHFAVRSGTVRCGAAPRALSMVLSRAGGTRGPARPCCLRGSQVLSLGLHLCSISHPSGKGTESWFHASEESSREPCWLTHVLKDPQTALYLAITLWPVQRVCSYLEIKLASTQTIGKKMAFRSTDMINLRFWWT